MPQSRGAEREPHVWTPLPAGGSPRDTQETRAGGDSGLLCWSTVAPRNHVAVACFCFSSKWKKLLCLLVAGPLTAFWEEVGDRRLLVSSEVIWEMRHSEQLGPELHGSTRTCIYFCKRGTMPCVCVVFLRTVFVTLFSRLLGGKNAVWSRG